MDIDGSDAFDRVFEKALDLSADIERKRATLCDKDVEIDRLNRAIKDRDAAAARAANASKSEAQSALDKLWRAAKKVVDEPMNLTAAAALKEVLTATAEVADPIPF